MRLRASNMMRLQLPRRKSEAGKDAFNKVVLDHAHAYPRIRKAFELVGITGGAGRGDKATLADMREVVRELDDSAVDVKTFTDVHLELAAAEAYLADGKGSPSQRHP